MNPVVSNSGPIIHLSMAGQLDLLPCLFGKVLVPAAVYRETVEDGAGLPGSAELRSASWAEVVDSAGDLPQVTAVAQLDPGERATLSLALTSDARLVLLDDLQARNAARRLGLKVMGTLGVLVLACRQGRIPAVGPVLTSLLDKGFWVSPEVVAEVLRTVGEEQ